MSAAAFSGLIRVATSALAISHVAAGLLISAGGLHPGVAYDDLSELGKLLSGIAERRTGAPDADGRRVEDLIASLVEERTGHRFGSRDIRAYLRGSRTPPPQFIPAFAETYSLTVKERRLVAWAHVFSEPPHPRTLEDPLPIGDEHL